MKIGSQIYAKAAYAKAESQKTVPHLVVYLQAPPGKSKIIIMGKSNAKAENHENGDIESEINVVYLQEPPGTSKK